MIEESQKNMDIALLEERIKSKADIEINKHDALVEAFKNRHVVYFGKIYEKDNKFLIKIGSIKEIQIRAKSLLNDLGLFTLLKIFECPRNEVLKNLNIMMKNIHLMKHF